MSQYKLVLHVDNLICVYRKRILVWLCDVTAQDSCLCRIRKRILVRLASPRNATVDIEFGVWSMVGVSLKISLFF